MFSVLFYVCIVQCAVCNVQRAVFSVKCAVFSVQSAVYSLTLQTLIVSLSDRKEKKKKIPWKFVQG